MKLENIIGKLTLTLAIGTSTFSGSLFGYNLYGRLKSVKEWEDTGKDMREFSIVMYPNEQEIVKLSCLFNISTIYILGHLVVNSYLKERQSKSKNL